MHTCFSKSMDSNFKHFSRICAQDRPSSWRTVVKNNMRHTACMMVLDIMCSACFQKSTGFIYAVHVTCGSQVFGWMDRREIWHCPLQKLPVNNLFHIPCCNYVEDWNCLIIVAVEAEVMGSLHICTHWCTRPLVLVMPFLQCHSEDMRTWVVGQGLSDNTCLLKWCGKGFNLAANELELMP